MLHFNDKEKFPRPDFVREDFVLLNGTWNIGYELYTDPVCTICPPNGFDRKIEVPFSLYAKRSGVTDAPACDELRALWYTRTFETEADGRTLFLCFGAVDYKCVVWINGVYAGSHVGGNTSFKLNVTALVKNGENEIVLRVEDSSSHAQPRGKQTWLGEPFECWYTETTGIWQNVWLEKASGKGAAVIHSFKITPDANALTAKVEVNTSLETNVVEVEFAKGDWFLGAIKIPVNKGYGVGSISFADIDRDIPNNLYWSPYCPNIIDVSLKTDSDTVYGYFGLRSITVRGSEILLNSNPLIQRLVLDQGYWPDTLLTPPDGDALRRDIEIAKSFGFNGARKHQKIEDPRFYYWADRLGFLVWGELPSAYVFNAAATTGLLTDMTEFVARDYNHPSIVCWVPFNESWGVRNINTREDEKNMVKAFYYLLKGLDPTRLVSTNDGWEQVSDSDICALHDYELTMYNMDAKYADVADEIHSAPQGRMSYAAGESWKGQPVLMTEYGGVSLAGSDGWGYLGAAHNKQELLERIGKVTNFLLHHPQFAGYCYTQLTDVMQEQNGLCDAERNPKLDPAEVAKYQR